MIERPLSPGHRFGGGRGWRAELRTEFTRCANCDVRNARAAALLAKYPQVAAQLGRDVALHRTECALAATGHEMSAKSISRASFAAMLRNLSLVGAQSCWQQRFAPVLLAGANPHAANPYPWAHLDAQPELREQLGEAVALVLAERVAASAPPAARPTTGLLPWLPAVRCRSRQC